MIQEYFGLTGEPFSKDVLPKNVYLSLRLLARLDYGVQKRCFCLVTGDIGAGKSTAIRLLAQNLDENKHKLLYFQLKAPGFLPELLFQLGSNPGYLRIDAKIQTFSLCVVSNHLRTKANVNPQILPPINCDAAVPTDRIVTSGILKAMPAA